MQLEKKGMMLDFIFRLGMDKTLDRDLICLTMSTTQLSSKSCSICELQFPFYSVLYLRLYLYVVYLRLMFELAMQETAVGLPVTEARYPLEIK